MASPQVENGYTRIANELLDQLIKADLTGTRLRIMLAVMRETYGWNRTSVKIGYQALSTEYGFARTLLIREMDWLVKHNYLTVKIGNSKTSTNVWSVQKDYSQWIATSHSQVTSDVQVTSHSQETRTSHSQVSSASHPQVTTPKTVLKTERQSGGDTRTRDAAAAVDQDVVSRLRKVGQSVNQANTYAPLQEFTAEKLDRIDAWYAVKKVDPRVQSAGRLLASFLMRGEVPDDLPPPPEPIELPIFDENMNILNRAAWEREYGPNAPKHLYHRG